MLLRRASHVYLGRIPVYVAPSWTGDGAAAAQDAVVAGAGLRIVTAAGTPAAQAAVVAGVAERSLLGSGTPVGQAATVAGAGGIGRFGSGTLVSAVATASGAGQITGDVTIALTVANDQELKDVDGTVWVSLVDIAWEWYDTPASTAGEPIDSGLFTTSAIGEATISVVGSGLANGEYGQLILYHPTNVAIRATLRVPVVK